MALGKKDLSLALVLVALLGVSCGGSGSGVAAGGGGDVAGGGDAGGGGGVTGGPTIETNNDVVANIPSLDPVGMDYSLVASASGNASRAKEYGGDGYDGYGDDQGSILVKVVEDSGTIKIFQCAGESQMGYASLAYDDTTKL